MVKLNAHFDGKVIVPDEPVSLLPNQKLRISIEPIEPPAADPRPRREFGQQKGSVLYVAPDFDDHLGDEFWGMADDTSK